MSTSDCRIYSHKYLLQMQPHLKHGKSSLWLYSSFHHSLFYNCLLFKMSGESSQLGGSFTTRMSEVGKLQFKVSLVSLTSPPYFSLYSTIKVEKNYFILRELCCINVHHVLKYRHPM